MSIVPATIIYYKLSAELGERMEAIFANKGKRLSALIYLAISTVAYIALLVLTH